MDPLSYKNPPTFKQIAVLLSCWAENSNNMATEKEVSNHRSVFDKRLHYQTHTECLNTDTGQRLQVQVNTRIASFVRAHQGPKPQLVVYCAGHAHPGAATAR